LGIAMKSSKDTYTNNSGTSITEAVCTGAWLDGSERGFLLLELNFITGADFYISKNLFMGIEMGFGLQSVTDSEVTLGVTGESDVTLLNKASTTEVGINFNLN
jgi:hypothetical protein